MVLLCVISLRTSCSGTLNDGGSYLYAQYGRTLHARGRAEPRNSAKPVRRWRYLHRVMRTKRKLKVLVCQLTELHPTRYTRDIRDRFELANTSKWGTSPVVKFPGSYAVKPYLGSRAARSIEFDYFSRLHGLIQLYNSCFTAETGLYSWH